MRNCFFLFEYKQNKNIIGQNTKGNFFTYFLRSMGEGNVFSLVCSSVPRGGERGECPPTGQGQLLDLAHPALTHWKNQAGEGPE